MIEQLVRKNILELKAYSSARDEFTGSASIFLDANESPFPSKFNRYPDPKHYQLKNAFANEKGISMEQVIFGNGSDEIIDLLVRSVCQPSEDEIIICPPTYGMYSVSANINQVAIKEVALLPHYQLDVKKILDSIKDKTKLIFVCSPNNPTGNLLNKKDIIELLDRFQGLVIVDEAYIDFAQSPGFIPILASYPNLFIMQTFSKARGLAGIRLGIGIGHPDLIHILHKVKPPYNINSFSQCKALQSLQKKEKLNKQIQSIIKERERLSKAFSKLSLTEKVYPSDANFILVKFNTDPLAIYNYLVKKGIIVRDRSKVLLCEGSLRFTVGTKKENSALLKALRAIRL